MICVIYRHRILLSGITVNAFCIFPAPLLLSMPVGNALFKPILQCVSRHTATHLVLQLVWANLSLCSSANSTLLQHVSSSNTNGCYKSRLLTLLFCFRTVNLELYL